jgi:glycine betaine/proline transport system substrate-binding protein
VWDDVGGVIDRWYWSPPGRLLEVVTQGLDRSADAVTAALTMLPLVLMALVVGLVVWRFRGLVAGVLAATAIGLLGLSRLLALTLETVAVALIAAVLAGLVAGLLTVVTARIRRGRHVDVLPGAGAGLVLAATVTLLPIAEPLAGRGANPAWVVTVGLIAGVLVTSPFAVAGEQSRGRRIVALVVTTLGVSLVAGLVGGWGLGGALGRALATSDLPAVLDAGSSVLLLTLLLYSVAIGVGRGRAADGSRHDAEPSVAEQDVHLSAEREAAR